AIEFTADGRLWALNADPPVVADVRTGALTRLPSLPRGFEPYGRISPDGRWGLTRERTKFDVLRVVEIRTGKPVLTLKADKPNESFAPETQFSPNGDRLALGSVGDRVEVWDVTSGQRVTVLTAAGHTDLRPSLLFRPGGRDLLTAGFDGTVR